MIRDGCENGAVERKAGINQGYRQATYAILPSALFGKRLVARWKLGVFVSVGTAN